MFEESKSFPAESGTHDCPRDTFLRIDGGARNQSVTIWLQLATVYFLIEAALWTRPGTLEFLWIGLASLALVGCMLAGHFSLKEMGIAVPTAEASRRIVLSGVILAATIPLLSMSLDYHSGPAHVLPWGQATAYAVWAVVQQLILQSFFFVRLESLLGGRRAVLASAALFAAVHIPNPVLTGVSLLGGLFFCEMFRRYRNIFALGLAHAMLGLVIAASFSDAVLRHMRVGEGYLNFHP